MITAVGVVIPARDEESTVGACLHAVEQALRRLPPHVEPAVCVVADRCSDRTADIAGAAVSRCGPTRVVQLEDERCIGQVRAVGMQACMSQLMHAKPTRALLLSTDADSLVEPDWARAHLAAANSGHHATAGAAELIDPGRLGPLTRWRYQGVVDDAARPDGHGNVYGANLGVRVDAYCAIGGFAPLPSGEDHDLWERLGSAGFLRCYDERARVRTSARLRGRAPAGLATLLQQLSTEP